MTASTNKRLLALDILRGMTIAGMILVNNPGSWGVIYAPLRHAAWNGLTPTDLVFPFFMFIMGISTYLSLNKYHFRPEGTVIRKIIRRTVVIFLIGLGIGWFSRFCNTFYALGSEDISFWERLGRSCWTFDRMRILGVLPRLALCYGAAALIAISVRHNRIPWIIGILLCGYAVILWVGHGFEISEANIVGVVDRAILGPAHMYREGDLAFDPEGLLSTLPAIAHVLIGFCCGKLICTPAKTSDKLLKLFLIGSVMMLVGWLLSYGCPINKKVWSPTFVLMTCGMASSLLALLIWIIDVKGKKRWSLFFESFGINPLFLYVTASILAILLGAIHIPHGTENISLHGALYQLGLEPLFGPTLGSLVYALLFVGVNWLIGYPLYKHKIYIKI